MVDYAGYLLAFHCTSISPALVALLNIKYFYYHVVSDQYGLALSGSIEHHALGYPCVAYCILLVRTFFYFIDIYRCSFRSIMFLIVCLFVIFSGVLFQSC